MVYIDESGDPNFNPGASKLLEFSAVLVEESKQEELQTGLFSILSDFSLKEFKSSGIRNENRRLKVIERISDLDFKFIVLTIDKDKVLGEWKQYRESFYKYCQKLLNLELHRLYKDRQVTLDKFGSVDYQKSLRSYLQRTSQHELFEDIYLIDSAKSNVLVQLSDILVGTYSKLKRGDFEKNEEFHEALTANLLYNFRWPDNYQLLKLESIISEKDKELAKLSIEYSERYIAEKCISETSNDRRITLEYLLFNAKYVNSNRYVYSTEILEYLREFNIELTQQQFRAEVIGKLRDDGVVIVASSQGYKLPMKIYEIEEYINFSTSRIKVQIKRSREMYRTLVGFQLNGLKIFDDPRFKEYKKIFKAIE